MPPRSPLFSAQQPGGLFAIIDVAKYPGDVFFVDGSIGNDSAGSGLSPDTPFDTLAYAFSSDVLSAGDVVVVMPGHTETIVAAAGVDMDIAGVAVVGLGAGSNKPTITMGTATTATIKMNAANLKLSGIRFVNNIDSLVKFVDVNADYATIEDCEFVTSSTKEALSFVNLATTKDYLTVRRCRFEQPTDPAGTDGGADTGAIFLVDSEYVLIEDCWFAGNFETAFVHNRTTACKELYVRNCWGRQALSGAEPFQLVAGATGAMLGGGFITPAETAATEATLVGTLGDGFFILPPGNFGNDGGAGGQGGIIIATAS